MRAFTLVSRAGSLLLLSSAAAFAQGAVREAIGTSTPTLTPAIRVGNVVYTSGQLGLRRENPDTTIQGQTKAALENIRGVLEQAGTTMNQAIRCTVWIVDFADFQGMNQSYREFWPQSPPARSTVVVKALVVPGAKVEIECMAAMPAK